MKILVAGIGNVFRGDDAFGVEVVQDLAMRPHPDSVTVRDFGIRAYDLAYALTGEYDAIVLVDSFPRGQAPGTVCLLEPDLMEFCELENMIPDAHTVDPVAILQMAQSVGEIKARIFLLGCEPAVLENESEDLALSAPVDAALPKAIQMIESLIAELLEKDARMTEAA